VDWIDQAILYVRVEDKEPRDFLRGYGIRNATDLDDVLADDARATALDRLLNLRLVGVPQYQDDGLPSRLAAVHAAIETERNLQHVRAWKGFSVGEAWVPASSATHAPAAAEEEPPPAAAPVPA
jgi:hypothetical protein